MPRYVYACENRHEQDVTHSINVDPEIICKVCELPTQRLPQVVVNTFNAKGFYSTDKNAR